MVGAVGGKMKMMEVMDYDYNVAVVHKSGYCSREMDEVVVKVFFLGRLGFFLEEGFRPYRLAGKLCGRLHENEMEEEIDYGFCCNFFLIFYLNGCCYGGDDNQGCNFGSDYDYDYGCDYDYSYNFFPDHGHGHEHGLYWDYDYHCDYDYHY